MCVPEISVAGAGAVDGYVPEPSRGVVVVVQGLSLGVAVRCVQQAPVLGDEEHDKPVGDAQECAVQVFVSVR